MNKQTWLSADNPL